MTAANTARSYGWVARLFHWSIAVLILTAIGLGLYAGSMPRGTEAELQAIFATFSVHKTVGVAALFLAVLRILWTLTQTKPRPLHPERLIEHFVAETVHWALWIGMVIMPLTGWLLHSSAPGGFSRILWPLGQRLPFVPEDAALSESFAHFHETGWWVLAALIVLHVAGAMKHALVDRDGTLNRMAGPADRAPEPPHSVSRSFLPHALAAVAALALWTGTVIVSAQAPEKADAPVATTAPASGWVVQQGTLSIEVKQGGSPIQGQFSGWSANIAYDPETQTGKVGVDIDVTSLTLGAVSDSAKGPDFLNAPQFPTARFEADIQADGASHIAKGNLTIAGKTIPAEMPFELTVDGDLAKAKGELQVDRRDFGIGASYADESTVGFPVLIRFDLEAKQQ
ncbi:cytochrome b/b6 domain-containing protein [Paracoccus aestuariivivens]|uniref:Cytochrome B n=1 Tax=Paracoccus aestuariivivens TaxID=1820333 RepID=A0A6L6J8C5_9RHOB|nr:cytochrome b/b6 domain-containing protein [Paracoccus aestuariivivens]MTH77418.1 cytochrome B [Paracoccus aestuariivivens]